MNNLTTPQAPSWVDPRTIQQRFAARLYEVRSDAKLSQEQLGEKANLGRDYISVLEHAHQAASIETLEKLSKAFGISISTLMENV